MTSRKALVVDAADKGPSYHGFIDDNGLPFFDTSPDRTEITFEGINCTSAEFIEWFLTLEERAGRFDLLWGDDETLIDIGGSPIDLTTGTILEIDFDDYFNALIENRITEANSQIERCVNIALLKFDTAEDNSTSIDSEPWIDDLDELNETFSFDDIDI